jgi:hypothetical protein
VLTAIRPFDVGAYVERLQGAAAAPSVKQELAAIRRLFDWLVVGQVMPANPAAIGARTNARREDRQDSDAGWWRVAPSDRCDTD